MTRLADGLLSARNVQEAEAFCRTTGDPTRLVEPADERPAPGVLFRCD